MMDDGELLRRYAEERSEEAFTALVQRHLDLVYSAACRQVGGDVHRARDVAQLVFTDLARKASSLREHTALVGWLYTSTHFTAAKLRRTEQRRAAREQEAHAMHELLGSDADATDWEKLRPVLDAAMHELKVRDRELLLLRFFEKRTFAEVGRHVGLGENAARMSVERALEKLGGLLARRGITSPGAALTLVLTNQAVIAAPAGMAGTVAVSALGQAALAGGAAGLGTAISFMANAKLAMSAAGLAALLAVGVGVFSATQAARAAAGVEEIERETAQLRARWREVDPRGAVAMATPARGGVARPTPVAPTLGEQISQAFLNDPESIQLRAQRDRNAASRGFGPMYQELGWNGAQIAQFEMMLETAIAEDFRAQGGVRITDKTMHLGPEITARLGQIRADFENNLRSVFGDVALQRFLAVEHVGDARAITAEIAGRVYFTATPLTQTQATALTRILATNSPQYAKGEPVHRTTLEWERVFAQAGDVLTAPQLGALRALRMKTELEMKREKVMFPETKP